MIRVKIPSLFNVKMLSIIHISTSAKVGYGTKKIHNPHLINSLLTLSILNGAKSDKFYAYLRENNYTVTFKHLNFTSKKYFQN